MKKTFLIILLPFLLAFQCDDDLENTGFETSYIIQNDSSTDLLLLNESNSFIEIESQSANLVGSTLNSETSPIAPSQSFVFNSIKLYRADNDDFIQVYDQTPLNNDLWILAEPVMNRFEYTLVITDDLLN